MMMSHESLESYYTNNFHVMFHKDIGFANHFTLEDWEDMLPYEREVYMAMIMQKIEEHKGSK